MKKIIKQTLRFFCLCVALLAPAQSAPRFNAQTFTLENGLQVVVLHNARAPVVSHTLWFKCGALDDPEGESGMAHFLEHMMFKGTKSRPAGQYENFVRKHGGEWNAITTRDMTYYYVHIAKEHLAAVMEMESDRMSNLVLDGEEVERERKVIIEERFMRIENEPGALLMEAANTALSWHHPRRRPTIGWLHEMKGLQLEGLRAFYRYWYAPNNAVLVLAGDVTVDEAKALAIKYYGPLKTRVVPERTFLEDPPHHNISQALSLAHPRVKHPTYIVAIPVDMTKFYKKTLLFSIIRELVFSNPLGTLYTTLVTKEKLASSVGFSSPRNTWDAPYIMIFAEPMPGVSLEALQARLQKEVSALQNATFSREQVRRVMDAALIAYEYEKDFAFSGADEVGEALCLGRSLEDVENLLEVYNVCTETEVNALIHQAFSTPPQVTATLLPEVPQS